MADNNKPKPDPNITPDPPDPNATAAEGGGTPPPPAEDEGKKKQTGGEEGQNPPPEVNADGDNTDDNTDDQGKKGGDGGEDTIQKTLDQIKSNSTSALETLAAIKESGEALVKQKEAEVQKEKSLAEKFKELNEMTVDSTFVENSTQLIGKLSFSQIIGGPLKAAIEAQRDMAKESLQYIKEQGLTKGDNGETQVAYVTMTYPSNHTTVKIRIPLLTLIPIPTLAIDTMTYTFKIKVDASSQTVATIGGGASPLPLSQEMAAKAKADNPPAKPATGGGTAASGDAAKSAAATAAAAKQTSVTTTASAPTLTASFSSKSDSAATKDSRYAVETNMDISISAKQNELPTGLQKLLEKLTDSAEEIDTKGALNLSGTDLVIPKNGIARLVATYLNKEGIYAPTEIVCKPLDTEKGKQPIKLPNGDEMLFCFDTPGLYQISAGQRNQLINVIAQEVTTTSEA